MNHVKRLCRVCMDSEWNGNLIPIFQTTTETSTASDILTISGVQIVDFPSCPALICFKCLEELSRAMIFRNRCRSTNEILNVTYRQEKPSWSDLNNSHENFDLKNEQEAFITIKAEPIEMESFFEEYPSFNEDAGSNSNEDCIDINQGYKEVKRHKKKIKSYECTICKKFLATDYSLKCHINVVHKKSQKQFTCKICKKSFPFKSKYMEHYQNVCEKMKSIVIGCHYCFKFFDQKTSLKDHIRYKHEVYDFICDGCGKSFTLKNKLIKHLREDHARVRPRKQRIKKEPTIVQCFPCVICGKICGSKTFLKSHERSHIKILPHEYFYCDLCGNKFRTKNPLEVHIKTRHILKLRYTCDKCPGKSWARKDHMKRHVKVVHENIRDFKCECCGKEFPERRKLECHMRIHTGERPFTCQFCGKKYTHETDYRRHIWSHTGERKYKCASCRRAFNKRSELIAHRSECVYYNYNQNNVNI